MGLLSRKTLVVLATAIPILLVLLGAYSVRSVLLLAAIGAGIGTLIAPAIGKMHKALRLPRGLGAALFLIVWFGVIFGVGYLVYTLAWGQLGDFIATLPKTVNVARDRMAELLRRFPSLSGELRKTNWATFIQRSLGTVLGSLKVGAQLLAALVYLIVTSLYLGASIDRYEISVLSIIPRKYHPQGKLLLREAASTLRHWFLAQLIAMACVGACASIGFLIIGLQYWLVLGGLTAILDIIPFVGPLIAAACAILVTLGSDSPGKVIWVVVNFVVVEHIESNLVVPLVMKGKIDIPPFYLLTLMLIFGSWFGILGVLIAPPVLAVTRTIYLMVYVPSINARTLEVEKKDKAA